MKANTLSRILCLAIGALIATTTATAVPKPTKPAANELKVMGKKASAALGVEVSVEKTPFTGIYTFYPVGKSEESGARLITADLTAMANNGTQGWGNTLDRSKLGQKQQEALWSAAVRDLPVKDAILFRKEGVPVSLMIFSAVDCANCPGLERFLEKNNISYGVFPWALADEKRALAADVWCDVEPQKAWQRVLLERKPPEQRREGECAYPATMISSIGSMFGPRKTPTLIFSDGVAMYGYDSSEAGQKNLLEIIGAVVELGMVFKLD